MKKLRDMDLFDWLTAAWLLMMLSIVSPLPYLAWKLVLA